MPLFLAGWSGFVGDNDLGARGIDELRSIMKFADAEGIGSRVEIDRVWRAGCLTTPARSWEINVKDLPAAWVGATLR